MDSTELQLKHFNTLEAAYTEHCGDEWSTEYVERFNLAPMFEGMNVQSLKILDAMCGPGQATAFLKKQGASQITGLDISNNMVKTYIARNPGCSGQQGSVTALPFPEESFDVVVISAGLHHLHPYLDEGLREIYRVLKKGGVFCFWEPFSGSLMDQLRRIWYRFDRKMFAENEQSVDLEALKMNYSDRFNFEIEKYSGGIPYLLILQTLVLRIPHGLKRFYCPLFLTLETWIGKSWPKYLSCIVSMRVRKK
jgi:SAM-dependent methyltransferase